MLTKYGAEANEFTNNAWEEFQDVQEYRQEVGKSDNVSVQDNLSVTDNSGTPIQPKFVGKQTTTAPMTHLLSPSSVSCPRPENCCSDTS